MTVLNLRRSAIPRTYRRDGLMVATCWCEQRFVTITQRDVREGRTESCGAPRCNPPRDAA